MDNVLRTNHVGFTVGDMDASLHRFQKLFGYQLTERGTRPNRGVELLTGVEGAEIDVAHLHHPDLIGIELIAYRAPADAGRMAGRPCDIGHTHLTFDVRDLDALVATALALGLEKVGRVVRSSKIPGEGAQVVYLRDPDGITIELIQPPSQ